jgi:type IV secretory pathway TrbD component
MNKAMLESYVRNLLGQVVAGVVVVSSATGIGSPLDFGQSEWLLVGNSLWASAIPTVLRWVNKKDPAFGPFAETATATITKKISTAASKKKK